ncbi:hypothetical protein [Arsenicicoccus dermatophilus]|uniref:hypothetical protein n=1 Tax=Arsenicicoccus dermatophilus TaxID=1076331 RepID=UPI001F4D19B7|nr:hypothetical protein [Arsenicicoccus dermatophilus]MCH8614474.1 hypothetical protein [Arsenicicoccus dermatophilus]
MTVLAVAGRLERDRGRLTGQHERHSALYLEGSPALVCDRFGNLRPVQRFPLPIGRLPGPLLCLRDLLLGLLELRPQPVHLAGL